MGANDAREQLEAAKEYAAQVERERDEARQERDTLAAVVRLCGPVLEDAEGNLIRAEEVWGSARSMDRLVADSDAEATALRAAMDAAKNSRASEVLAVRDARTAADAWDEGLRHNSECPMTWGRFCLHLPECNPYRTSVQGGNIDGATTIPMNGSDQTPKCFAAPEETR